MTRAFSRPIVKLNSPRISRRFAWRSWAGTVIPNQQSHSEIQKFLELQNWKSKTSFYKKAHSKISICSSKTCKLFSVIYHLLLCFSKKILHGWLNRSSILHILNLILQISQTLTYDPWPSAASDYIILNGPCTTSFAKAQEINHIHQISHFLLNIAPN